MSYVLHVPLGHWIEILTASTRTSEREPNERSDTSTLNLPPERERELLEMLCSAGLFRLGRAEGVTAFW